MNHPTPSPDTPTHGAPRPTPSFCLLDQPWIPCIDQQGAAVTLGLRQVLERAHVLQDVVGDNPLQTSALFRLILALMHRVVDGPRSVGEWCELWDAGVVDPKRLSSYLQGKAARFDLFHPETPFFQVSGLVTVNGKGAATDPAPAAALAMELASGNNATLFDHTFEADRPFLSAAGAARALVTTQTWGLGGGKGPTTNVFGAHPYMSHAPLVGAWFVQLGGRTLFERLLANLLVLDADRPVPQTGDDAPIWEQDAARPPADITPLGYLDYLTLPARYVRLLPDADESGQWGVRQAYVCPGLTAKQTPSPSAFFREDPKRGRLPIGLRPGRALWRDAASLLSRSSLLHPQALEQAAHRKVRTRLSKEATVTVRCFGLANDKAKPVQWRDESLTLSAAVLDDPDQVTWIAEAVQLIEEHATALRNALWTAASEAVGSDRDRQRSTRDTLFDHGGFWPAAGTLFESFLLDPSGGEKALDGLRGDASQVARGAFARATRFVSGSPPSRLRAVARGQMRLARELAQLAPQPEAERHPEVP